VLPQHSPNALLLQDTHSTCTASTPTTESLSPSPSPHAPYPAVPQHYEYNWLVDPLDGTKEFISRNGQFTVNIALLQAGSPVFGVVHVPCENKTYWAMKGRGAFARFNGEQTQLKAAQFGLKDKGLTIVASARHQSQVGWLRSDLGQRLLWERCVGLPVGMA
jgi:3'-phosphoadenosine 5'-phosphosulfate (PAPS) 3'-phosphatase